MSLLTIDIGNTRISMGLMRGRRVKKTWSTATVMPKSRLDRALKKGLVCLSKPEACLEAVLICSVVPSLGRLTEGLVRRVLKIKPLVIGRDLKVPVKNRYHRPRQVGQDRLVCAFAARELYGCPAVVVDLGTAMTFDVVSKKGEYLGGLIVPGIRLSAEALFRKTALLPHIDIASPKSLIGRNTKDSMLSGIFHGYGALIDGLIVKINRQMRGRAAVIITGGHASIMKRFAPSIRKVDPGLIFKGMALVWRAARPSGI